MEKEEKQPAEMAAEESVYEERPAWQVWLARLGLVLFIILVILQIVGISRGGW